MIGSYRMTNFVIPPGKLMIETKESVFVVWLSSRTIARFDRGTELNRIIFKTRYSLESGFCTITAFPSKKPGASKCGYDFGIQLSLNDNRGVIFQFLGFINGSSSSVKELAVDKLQLIIAAW